MPQNYKLIDYINQNYDIHDVYAQVFGRTPPSGKFVCPNPEHVHKSNTPSAKIYGNIIKCYGACQRCFGSYDLMKWYMPDEINRIKSTVIVEAQQLHDFAKQRLVKVPIDRTQPIAQVLKTIVGDEYHKV